MNIDASPRKRLSAKSDQAERALPSKTILFKDGEGHCVAGPSSSLDPSIKEPYQDDKHCNTDVTTLFHAKYKYYFLNVFYKIKRFILINILCLFVVGRKDVQIVKSVLRNTKRITKTTRMQTKVLVTRRYFSQYCQEIRSLKKTVAYYKKKQISYRKRLKFASAFLDQMKKLPPTVSRFVLSQIENLSRKAKGRKFSVEDKILALLLYKKSPKCYKLLSKIFVLPGQTTLQKLINKVQLSPGICMPVFANLQTQVTTHFQYDKYKDYIEGCEDNGTTRSAKIGDHVQVYMLRGIFGKWKQPVAYTLCKSTTCASNIVNFYKQIVTKAHSIGLKVIASVCDQGATNTQAIKILKQQSRACALKNNIEPREGIITIDGNTVAPLFDPPHLLKCIRNNLLTKDLRFKEDGKYKTAKWSHIQDACYIDSSAGKLRVMPKLTDFQIIPSKIHKMKVSVCTQVFSRTTYSSSS